MGKGTGQRTKKKDDDSPRTEIRQDLPALSAMLGLSNNWEGLSGAVPETCSGINQTAFPQLTRSASFSLSDTNLILLS